MTFLELCQRVREEAGISGLGPTTVVGQVGQLKKVVDWTAAAWVELQNKRSAWNFMWNSLTFDTTVGEDAYTVGTTQIKTVTKVSIYDKILGKSNESVLDEVSYDELEMRHKVGEEKLRRPDHYAIRPDNAIVFGPTPEKVYVTKVWYYRKPQKLTANTDIPLMPEEYHMLIAYMALRKMSAHYESTVQYQDFREEMKDLMDDLERTQLPEMKIAGPLT